jgi:hypothetical protein
LGKDRALQKLDGSKVSCIFKIHWRIEALLSGLTRGKAMGHRDWNDS